MSVLYPSRMYISVTYVLANGEHSHQGYKLAMHDEYMTCTPTKPDMGFGNILFITT